ncbi:FHA domain-containing protein [Xenophilus azovorans]|uniref:FHA domain-containing protein n=2 Tax=Xenophilus TaxID=151754 RepID=UPI001470824F|nr:FHA domain-containing protein [Xenophilus azovorans]
MHKLIVTRHGGERQIIELDRPRMTIGRAHSSDLPLDAPLVSRVHALISLRDEGVYLSDLDSSNGTHVNGRRIERCQLHHRDVIRVGDVDMRYLDESLAVQHDEPATVAPCL